MSKIEDRRRLILQHVGKHGSITKKQAVEIVPGYYCNSEKHVGEILSRLVKSGLLKRIKPGLFEPGDRHATRRKGFTDPNAPKLFGA